MITPSRLAASFAMVRLWPALAMAGALCLTATGCATNPPPLAPPPPATTASITPVTRNALSEIELATSERTTAPAVTASAAQPLKIAVLLPLGGFDQTAAIAKGLNQAAEMAVFEAGQANVQLIIKDDKGTAEGAKAAAEEAIKDGAEIILGPLFSRSVAAVAPVAQAANVPVLAFSNDRQVAGRNVYVLGFLPEQDASRMAFYATAQGKKRFAAILPDDAYGQVIGAAFKAAAAEASATVVVEQTYPAGANAMIGPSRRIVEALRAAEAQGAPIDAVFVPGGQDALPQLGPLLAYAGFDNTKVKLMGSGAWEFANVGTIDMFVGGWYPGPDPHGWRDFTGRYVKSFGVPPPRMATVAYDAVTIAISLSASAPAGQRFTPAALTRPAGFSGVDGPLRLLASGITERALAVLEVQKSGSMVLDAAPGSLDGARVSIAPSPRVN